MKVMPLPPAQDSRSHGSCGSSSLADGPQRSSCIGWFNWVLWEQGCPLSLLGLSPLFWVLGVGRGARLALWCCLRPQPLGQGAWLPLCPSSASGGDEWLVPALCLSPCRVSPCTRSKAGCGSLPARHPSGWATGALPCLMGTAAAASSPWHCCSPLGLHRGCVLWDRAGWSWASRGG